LKDFDAYLDFLVKWKVIGARVPVTELVTNDLIDEINRFDPAQIAADAKAYRYREPTR
jgi:NitT/TauT family transport system substrate-binding protein